FVRQSMKSVTAYAGVVQFGGDRKPLRNGWIGRVERGIEARDLREIGPARQQHPDRRQIVRLVQWRERNESLQACQHLAIDPHRTGKLRPTVHDAMTHRLELHSPGLVPEELGKVVHRALVTELPLVAPAFFCGDHTARGARNEMRRGVDALDLPAQLRVEPAVLMLVEQELDARRARVQYENGPAVHDTAFSNCMRREWAISTATAQDAWRAINESARLVRMIGTRAPSTIPAASAPAMNVRLLASMLPASRSGTTRTSA